jgi:hypothetical protein
MLVWFTSGVCFAQQAGVPSLDSNLDELERMLDSDLSGLGKSEDKDKKGAEEEREASRDPYKLTDETQELSRNMFALEAGLVAPLGEMSVVYFALADSRVAAPTEVVLTLDGLPLSRHRYTPEEQQALLADAVQPLYVGYVRPGVHRLQVTVKHARGQSSANVNMDTNGGRALVGLQLGRNGVVSSESWR